ncbi:hypothetical protein EKO24_017825 [Candidatus Methylobacter oryzae]|uniref:Uncharacterized protein n=1 Tax=Candidatus Methylobacter oryzae TaxID=2497749 RepID=A0ABY3C6A2_9GAMM|nr:hypothetical protein EKO24_017825 [Candidatus Methylobacter oryzae]
MYSTSNATHFLSSKQQRAFKTTDFQRDILIGLMFFIGIPGFLSGEFIVSTIMFATAALFSNIVLSRKLLG